MGISKPDNALSSDEPVSSNGPFSTHESLSSHELTSRNASLPSSQPVSPNEPLQSKTLACPLIDKLPLELRLEIYRLLLPKPQNAGISATATTAPRLRWKPSSALPPRAPPVWPWRAMIIPKPAPRARATPRSPDSIDTVFFEVCKLIYEEAHQELITKSTLIIDIKDVKEIHQFPTLIAHMRRIEIRDPVRSENAQLFEPTWLNPAPPKPFKRHDLAAWGITQLRWIRKLLGAAPSLSSVVVGFEVVRVTMPLGTLTRSRSPFDPGTFDLFQSLLHDITVRGGMGRLDCYDVGRWRAPGDLQHVEFRHFPVLDAYETLTRDPCECASIGLANFRHDLRMLIRTFPRMRDPYSLWRRHAAGCEGVLGEEAQRYCSEGSLLEAMSFQRRSWEVMMDCRSRFWREFDAFVR